MASNKKELRDMLDALEAQGFRVRRTSKGHWQVTKPGLGVVSVFGGTPSDSRSTKNSLADCKRAGFIWPAPAGK